MNRFVFAAVLVLAACSGDGNGSNGPPSGGIDRSNAIDAATASADETEQVVDAIAGTASALAPSGLRAGFRSLAIPLRPLCATSSSTTDSDGDGTPDNATFTYALPACALADFRGGDLELTGAIQLTDTDPLPGYAYRLEYQDFAWRMTMPDTTRSFTATRNGIRRLALENGTLVLASTVSTQRTFGARGDGFVATDVRSVFTPDVGTLVFGDLMPPGHIVETGTVTMIRNGVNERYDVRTVTPLAVDETCAAHPRISSGEVHYVLGDSSYVRVTWPGCGIAPVVEAVGP
jgi:hypothetical protein